MVYSLDLYIIGSQTLRDQILALIPAAVDPQIWDGDYENINNVSVEDINFQPTGQSTYQCMVRFNQSADRDTVEAALNNVAGVLNNADVGSYVQLHTCYHDEVPPKSCTVELKYEVTV